MKERLKIHRIIVALLTLLVIYVGFRYYDIITDNGFGSNKEISSVVLSLEDNFDKNDYWVGTFNLLWNNLYEELDLKDVSNQSAKNENIIANLNKKTFTKDYVSSGSYYNKHGYASKELKNTIKKDLKKKFNTTSSILDDCNWDGFDYFIYSMFYKELKFKYQFENLDKGKFKNTDNVAYFGIKNSSSDKLKGQVQVLYYQDINNFAVKLLTISDDEVILVRGATGNNFLSVYENMQTLTKKYDGSKDFEEQDQLMVPVIDFHNHDEVDELKGVELATSVDVLTISQVVRDITFKLDANGGKLKDEVAVGLDSALDKKTRFFNLTSDFNLFLKEKKADLPYFAVNVSDITKFQNVS